LYKKLLIAQRDGDANEIAKAEAEIPQREREYKSVAVDYLQLLPSYFNSGCCCYSDGDITGIEITDGHIALIKWSIEKGREILESASFAELLDNN
jgi:hypothetical protein